MKTRTLFPIIVMSFFIASGRAQEVTGRLQGWVLDSESRPLAGVNVSMTGPQLQGTRGTGSNEQGRFNILLLPPGLYTVRLSHVAHQPVIFENVRIQLGKTTSLGQITLAPRTIAMKEVVVTVSRPILDPTSASIGANFDANDLEPLPLDRNYIRVAEMIPQANMSFYGEGVNIAGSTGLENAYFIDGINVTDPAYAIAGTNLPYNFLREVEIRTAGYEAEFASALGGIINATTRSGGNTFHGQLFGFFTSDALFQQERAVGLAESFPGTQTYDVGFGLGGPILPDKLWFYAAYNPNFRTTDIELAGFGLHTAKTSSHLFAGKLTWRAAENANVVFTTIGDPSTTHGVSTGLPGIANVDVALIKQTTGGMNQSVQIDYQPKQNLLLRGVASYARSKRNFEGDTERGRTEPRFIDQETRVHSGGLGNVQKRDIGRTEILLTATRFMGNHTVKGGLAYEDNSFDRMTRFDIGGLGRVQRTDDSTYSASPGAWIGQVHNRIPSVFLQDSWQIMPGLRLNFGLRWDAQYMIGDDGKIAQRITDQWQPRAGVIFQPGKTQSHKLFASFGRFYERIPTGLSALHHLKSEWFDITYDHNHLIDPSGGDTTRDPSNSIVEEVIGLKGQYVDEVVLGYEVSLFERYKLGIRGVYRHLGEAVEDAFDLEQGKLVIGNPGKGDLDFLPKLWREYTGLELTVEKAAGSRLSFLTSYVLSRTRGNYTGLFDSDYTYGVPNTSPGNDLAESLVNAEGLLPNDRRHVFKLVGSYRTKFGFDIGNFFTWQSGNPLNELGATTIYVGYRTYVFLQQRGTVGRTPSTWYWNVRLTYNLGRLLKSSLQPRLIVDALNLASRRTAITFNQRHFFATDAEENQTSENPDYLTPTRYQRPMIIRLGMQVDF